MNFRDQRALERSNRTQQQRDAMERGPEWLKQAQEDAKIWKPAFEMPIPPDYTLDAKPVEEVPGFWKRLQARILKNLRG
jgi:hypothetical protein